MKGEALPLLLFFDDGSWQDSNLSKSNADERRLPAVPYCVFIFLYKGTQFPIEKSGNMR